MKLETRTGKLTAEQGDQYKLDGIVNDYGKLSGDLGGFRERIAPGAFTRSLEGDEDIKCDFNHDPAKILGRTDNGTLELEDSDEGLAFSVQLDPNQVWHRDLFHAVKRGDINSMSFAFNVLPDGDAFEEGYDDENKRCTIRSVSAAKLHAISVVSYPAYGSTSVAARSAMGFGRNLFPKSLEQRFVDAHGYDPWLMDMKARRQAAEIVNEHRHLAALKQAEKFRAEEQRVEAEYVREMRARLFPWEKATDLR